ncbi:hypothetical protein FRC03_003824 [Tulasnella sp. 419]|nr:hypothetical protein FRC03_003824 [Tulasnella sp. 419]
MLPDIELSQSVVLASLDQMVKRMTFTRSLPEENEVDQIQMKINSIAAAAETFQIAVNSQLSRHRRRRNLLASRLLQLPNEIISIILLSAADPNSCQVVKTLRLVCFQFYQITESTASFWSSIKFPGDGTGWIRAQLSRAKEAPLNVHLRFKRCSDQEQAVFDLLCQHMRRWKTFNLELAYDTRYAGQKLYSMLRRFSGAKAPLLKEFKIKEDYSSGLITSPLDLFSDYPPHLRRFQSPITITSWDNPIISDLTHLSISAWDGFGAPSAEQYARVLELCPNLEKLKILGLEEHYFTSNNDPFIPNFHLQRLQSLELAYVPSSIVRSILSSIPHQPKKVVITLPNLRPRSHMRILQEVLQAAEDTPWFSESYYSAQEVRTFNDRITASISAITDRGDGNVASLVLETPDIESPTLFLQPMLQRSSQRLRSLTINPHVPINTDSYPARQLLEGLSKLEKLTFFSANEASMNDAFELLSDPMECSDQDTAAKWFCPSLDQVRIHTLKYDLSNIQKLVELRYQHTSGHHPRKLSLLEVSGKGKGWFGSDRNTHQEAGRALAEIVGRDAFEWESHMLNGADKWEPLPEDRRREPGV